MKIFYTYENRKALIMSAFSIFYMPLLSLPHAEVLEYRAEHLVCCDFATGDFGQMVDALAEVLCHKVAGNARLQTAAHTAHIIESGGQCGIVARIGHHHVAFRFLRRSCRRNQPITERRHALPFSGGEEKHLRIDTMGFRGGANRAFHRCTARKGGFFSTDEGG